MSTSYLVAELGGWVAQSQNHKPETRRKRRIKNLRERRNSQGVPGTSYSCRKAIIGSTFVARLAGINDAATATNTINNAAPTRVRGSPGLIWKSWLASRRISNS